MPKKKSASSLISELKRKTRRTYSSEEKIRIIIELKNGVGHPVWSWMQHSYTPAVITAPFLLVTALLLIKSISSKLPS
jgi:hypothetical protein